MQIPRHSAPSSGSWSSSGSTESAMWPRLYAERCDEHHPVGPEEIVKPTGDAPVSDVYRPDAKSVKDKLLHAITQLLAKSGTMRRCGRRPKADAGGNRRRRRKIWFRSRGYERTNPAAPEQSGTETSQRREACAIRRVEISSGRYETSTARTGSFFRVFVRLRVASESDACLLHA